MNAYPIHLHIQDRMVVLVGAGKVAERKVRALRNAGAQVRLIAPDATPGLQFLAEEGALEWRAESFQPLHLDGAFLVLACTNDREVNQQVTQEALARGQLVLCADDPEAGNFVSPATVTRGDLVLSVSTGGKSPTLATVVHDRLERDYGPEWAALTALIGEFRAQIQAIPDVSKRQEALRRMVDDTNVILIARGRAARARERMEECLSSFSE